MLISFGELLVDMIRKDNEEIFYPYPGGAPANFSVALARLGLRPKLVASVGKDFFGDMLLRSLEKENIDLNNIKRSDKKTTLVFVELKNTVPEFIFYRNADVDIKKENVDDKLFLSNAGFHFGSLSLTENPIRETLFHCLKTAKENFMTVSFSPNLRSDLWNKNLDAYLFDALKYVDILIASRGEFKYMFGSKSPHDVRQGHGIEKLVITKGNEGCVLYPTENGQPDAAIIHHTIFPVDVVDTTGAGDAFAAGFVYSVLNNKTDREAVRFASAVAALSTTKKGAMSALPTKKEVEEFLSNYSDTFKPYLT